jgi:hypothetical protein
MTNEMNKLKIFRESTMAKIKFHSRNEKNHSVSKALLAFIFLLFIVLFASTFAFGQVWISSYEDLDEMRDGYGENDRVFVISGTITYQGSPLKDSSILFLRGTGTTLNGNPSIDVASIVNNFSSDLAGTVVANRLLDTASIYSTFVKSITNFNSAADEMEIATITYSGGSQRVVENNALGGVHDPNKIFSFRLDSTGISLKNLKFTSFDLINNFNGTLWAGVTNGFIGNAYNIDEAIDIRKISGNIFNDISISMYSNKGDNKNAYFAGGGIIGVRSAKSSAKIGSVSGNIFKNIQIQTAYVTEGTFLASPVIEGGGIIGMDAVASPDESAGAAAMLSDLSDNYFNSVVVNSGDSIVGGGIVGLNNKNQFQVSGPLQNNVILSSVKNNIFAGNINVIAGNSLRGGGVIGLNGVSYSTVDMPILEGNFFAGVTVFVGSFLRGGGVVGLQSFDEATSTADNVNANLTEVKDNVFLGINVSTGNTKNPVYPGGNIIGGGIIGIHAEAGDALINSISNNTFKGIVVVTKTKGSSGLYAGDIEGGGVIGLDSKEYGAINEATGNYFDVVQVTVGGSLYGGGVIGLNTAVSIPEGSLNEESVLGTIEGNIFTNITVDVQKGIDGGGVIGTRTGEGLSAVIGVIDNTFDFINVNIHSSDKDDGLRGGGLVGVAVDDGRSDFLQFNNNTVKHFTMNVSTYVEGGAILGVRSGTPTYQLEETFIADVKGNDIGFSTINVDGYISGGGIIGAFGTGGVAAITDIVDNAFYILSVNTGTYIDGGGIIGANGKMGITQVNTLSNITDTFIAANKITAKEGQILGGIIYTYGSENDIIIKNSVIVDNQMTSNVNPSSSIYSNKPSDYAAKVYGTITIDTGLKRLSGDPITVWVQSDETDVAGFSNNIITENTQGKDSVVRKSSLYFGETYESRTDPQTGKITVERDAVRSDAVLNISAKRDGSVFIFDSIYVDQIDSNNSSNYFQMNVYGDSTGEGQFHWDGASVFTANPNTGNTINFLENSFTQIYPGMTLEAANHVLNINKDASWEVWGFKGDINNRFVVSSANIQGTLHLHLTGDSYNDPSKAILTIIPTTGVVNLTGSTIELSNFRITDGHTLTTGDRYYLIDTGSANKLTIGPIAVNVSTKLYQTGEEALQYTFVIDTQAGPEVEGNSTNRYLVARLEEEPVKVAAIAPPSTAPVPPPVRPTPVDPAPGQTATLPADDAGIYPLYVDGAASDSAAKATWVSAENIVQEGHLAAMAFVSQAGTVGPAQTFLLAERVITENSWRVFYGADGYFYNLNGESDIEMQGVNMLLGVGKKFTHGGGGKTIIAAYAEGGRMEYDVDGNFKIFDANLALHDVTGTGKINSVGGGIILRHTFGNNISLEGSVRGGQVDNEFKTNNYQIDGANVEYDYKIPYYGAHLGAVYSHQISERTSLDFMGGYFWTYVPETDADIAGKDIVIFKAAQSNRVRGGLRLTRETGLIFKLYGGVYMDCELSSKASGHSVNNNIDFRESDLKGATGVFEVGGVTRFKNLQNVTLEFGFQGYLGKYKGINGGFRVGVEF